uniref:CCHC-type domain-containing protein n=1 Tax=Quercus lobata TaxID=97700 RepID=A0A7N2N6N9_QUELO
MAEVTLSKETKARIRAPWAKALIVKVYGKFVGFNYLTFKINALWKPIARMDCVNLGKDYFLIRFSNDEDYDKVLRGGPWFVGGHFLAIKPWEPYFKAFEDKLTLVAVWVRFPELPIEFYDTSVLKEIGSAIGPVLRIDSYTASETRGKLVQQVLYEGISILCFCCGRLGHKQENCCYRIKSVTRDGKEARLNLNEGMGPPKLALLQIFANEGISEARENQVISTQEMDLCQEALNKGKKPEGRVLEAAVDIEEIMFGICTIPQVGWAMRYKNKTVIIPGELMAPIQRCDVLLCSREDTLGILKHMMVWKSDWVASKNILRRMGWSMVEIAMMNSNPLEIEVPLGQFVKMNILLWNCKGALSADFKRRIFEMAINHHPSIMVITETRVGGDRAARIIEDLPFDGSIVTETIGYAGGLWLLWKTDDVDVMLLSSIE